MLDIFKWECTINETCQENFPWKYCILHKKHIISSPEKCTSSDEKEYNCLSFYARIKTKTVLESLMDFPQTYVSIFKFSFTFSFDMRFLMGN